MSKADRKRSRKLAAELELERRWRAAEASSPLSRADLDALIERLSERIVSDGHDGTFRITREWLSQQDASPEPALAFLAAHRVTCDFDVLLYADPCALFGPTALRLRRMPIERNDLEALQEWLDIGMREEGCDNTLRRTREWLSARGFPVAVTLTALLAQGGGCDCEVVLNVEAETIYPPAPTVGRTS